MRSARADNKPPPPPQQRPKETKRNKGKERKRAKCCRGVAVWHARCGSVACARACMGHTTQGGSPAPLADRCFLMESAHHRPHLTPSIDPADDDFPQPTSRMDAARGIVSVTTASNGPTTQCPVRRRSERKHHTQRSQSQIKSRRGRHPRPLAIPILRALPPNLVSQCMPRVSFSNRRVRRRWRAAALC